MILSKYFKNFFSSSQSSGIILIFCVVLSLLIANSSIGIVFQEFFNYKIGTDFLHLKYPISIWINDGLMAVFFLLVGLEIKRELLEGELSSFKLASLPIIAAIGGMIVPALIFVFFNSDTKYVNGWAIPMATDIAFSLAIISLLGKKVPASLKIFLTALAIVDDLGAIIVIAIFYTNEINWIYLGCSALLILLLFLLNRLKIKNLLCYLLPGVVLWYLMHHSGIHATIAGVLLAFTIPTNVSKIKISPLEKLEEKLHFPVHFLIMPLFAFANTAIILKPSILESVSTTLGLGIIFGLFFGKVLGINLFSYLAIQTGISKLPKRSNWKQMIGVGFLAGIGFTMSIFIALLSFPHLQEIQDEAKFSILLASIISGIFGYFFLRIFGKSKNNR